MVFFLILALESVQQHRTCSWLYRCMCVTVCASLYCVCICVLCVHLCTVCASVYCVCICVLCVHLCTLCMHVCDCVCISVLCVHLCTVCASLYCVCISVLCVHLCTLCVFVEKLMSVFADQQKDAGARGWPPHSSDSSAGEATRDGRGGTGFGCTERGQSGFGTAWFSLLSLLVCVSVCVWQCQCGWVLHVCVCVCMCVCACIYVWASEDTSKHKENWKHHTFSPEMFFSA